jgi:hypothetical protein
VSHDVLGTLLAVLAHEVEIYCIADNWWSRADSDGGWSDVNTLKQPARGCQGVKVTRSACEALSSAHTYLPLSDGPYLTTAG